AEEAFLAGMIHDIGLLVALQVWPDQLRQVCARVQGGESDFCAVEQEVYGGVDHPQLGQAVAELWKFPRACQQVAGFHHRPEALPADTRLLTAVVYVADTLCATHDSGFPLTARNQELATRELEPLELPPALLNKLS